MSECIEGNQGLNPAPVYHKKLRKERNSIEKIRRNIFNFLYNKLYKYVHLYKCINIYITIYSIYTINCINIYITRIV